MLLMVVSLVFGNSSLSLDLVSGLLGCEMWSGKELPLIFHSVITAKQAKRVKVIMITTGVFFFWYCGRSLGIECMFNDVLVGGTGFEPVTSTTSM